MNSFFLYYRGKGQFEAIPIMGSWRLLSCIFDEKRKQLKGILVEIGGDITGLDKTSKSINSSITKTDLK